VSAAGLYSPQTVGTHTVTASAAGKAGTAQVTVTPGAAVSVSISPPRATITADQTQQFAASGQDAKGNPVATFSWVASGGAVTPAGFYTPDKVGQWQVTASSGGKNAVAQVFVTPGRLATMSVSPDGITLAADKTQHYSAVGRDAKGNNVPVSPAWRAEDGAIDSQGRFEPQKAGTWEIGAEQDGIADTVTVTVVPGAIDKLVISPESATLDNGQRVEFKLRAADVKGNEIPVSDGEVAWEQVGGRVGRLSGEGALVAEMPGTATVRATMSYGGATRSAEAKVTVHWWLLYLLFVALVSALIAGAAIARRRRRKRRMKSGQRQILHAPDLGPQPSGNRWGPP
jgi:hypothetical protein